RAFLTAILFGAFFVTPFLIQSEIIEAPHEANEHPTDEPIPQGPFISIPTSVENMKLEKNEGSYRKWSYDRVFHNDKDTGVTFHVFEMWMDSPIFDGKTKHKKNKVHIHVDPRQTKKVVGYTWLDYGTSHSENDLH